MRYATRRSFLQALGVSGAAAPFIPLLDAHAQEVPKRLVLFFTPHGTIDSAWKPTGTETAFTVGPILAPLQPLIDKKKVNILSGLDIYQGTGPGAPHTKGPPLLWTASPLMDGTFVREDGSGGRTFGWNSAPSVDQVVAKRVAMNVTTPYPSLELGVSSGGSFPGARMSYSAPSQPRTPQSNPYTLVGNLFAGGNNKAYEQLRAERRSTIDLLKPELDAIKGKVGGEDRLKIDAHLSSIRGIETRLAATATTCTGPNLGTPVNTGALASIPALVDAQMQIMARALACNLTRVISLQYRVGENDGNPYPWLGVNDGHHSLSHAADADMVARDKLIKIYTWYAQKFADLLTYLDAIPEAGGTVLDNSLVVWGSELGKGNSHDFRRAPFVVGGRAGGKVAGGRYLEYPRGTNHCRLLVSMCQLMGLTDVQTFGSNDNGTGPLARLAT